MKVVVVDTSALLRLFIPDGPIPAGLEARVADAARHEAVLLAPTLIFVEATQVLLKKERAGYLSSDEADLIRDAILDMPIEPVSSRELIAEAHAHAVARASGLTAYDAMFLALARSRRAELITADQRLARAWSLS